MADNNQYKISLGVDVDTSDIKSQLSEKAKNISIPIKLEIKNLNDIKTQIQGLSDIKINLNVGTGGSNTTIKQTTNELKKIQNLARQIGKLEFKIGKLDTSANVNEIKELERQLAILSRQYNQTVNDFNKKGISGYGGTVAKEFVDAKNKLAEFEAKLVDTKAKLASDIKLKIDDGTFNNDISNINSKFGKLSNQSAELKLNIDKVEQALKVMSKADDIDSLINANEEYVKALKNVQNQLQINAREEKDIATADKLTDDIAIFQSKIDAWLTKNSAASKQFGAELQKLRVQAENCDRATLNHLEKEFKQIDKAAEAAGVKMQTLGDRIKTQFSKYSSYFSVASVFMYTTQALRSMFDQVVAIDSAMTELKKVTDETSASYDKFLTNAGSRAKEIGTTVEGLVSSTADFARLGYSFEDSQGLAEVANIYAVVGDEINGVEDATLSLISTLTAFKDEASGLNDSDFAMSIVDKMNEVSNNFAISSGGIGDALQRSASSMQAANNSLDETIALITAANSVVQDPDAVGTAFKTISMRIRGAKTELEEAGLETDGMVESTAKLRQEILALSGVDIMLNENEFKSTYQIMEELANKWQDLTDIQQASVTELIAGKRQGNIVSSLMNNFDIAEQALETSLNSAGSAMREHEKWQQSLEAQLLKLQAAWQSLSQSFLSSDFLKVTLDGVIGLVDGVNKLIDTFGVLPTLTTLFAGGKSLISNKGIFKTFNTDLDGFVNKVGIANKSFAELANSFNSGKTGTGIKGFVSGLKSVGDSLKNTLTDIDISNIQAYNNLIDDGVDSQTAFQKTMKNSSAAAQSLVSSANGGKVAMQGLTTATNASKLAMIGTTVAATAMNAAITLGISFLITTAISAIQKWINAEEELAEKVNEVTSKYREQHDELVRLKGDYNTSNEDSMISKYERLSKGVNALGENVSLTSDEYAEYQSIVDTIANQFPSLVAGFNSQGDAILSCAGDVDKLVESYRNLIKEQNKEVLDTGEDIFKDFKNDINKTKEHGVTGVTAVQDLKGILSGDWDISHDQMVRVSALLEEHGIKRDVLGSGEKGYETYEEHIKRAIQEDVNSVKSILDEAAADINAYAEDLGTVTDAYFSTAFLGGNSEIGDYSHMSERMQNVINQIVSDFDSDFYDDFLDDKNPYESLTKYFDEMLSAFDSLGKKDVEKFEAAFDLQTQFNGGEISYGEYVKSLEDAGNLISGLNLDEEVKTQIKLSLGLNEDGLVEEYETLNNRLIDITTKNLNDLGHFSGASDAIKAITEDTENFLNSLSAEELSVVTDIIPELDAGATIEEIQSAINREMAVRGLTFDLNLEVETASIEALNTAMAETVSGAGLSSESIAALKSRYADLESEGYNLSAMFEETSNGIHLNRKAVGELEQAYAKQKQSDIKEDIDSLKKEYDLLTKDIDECTDAQERVSLYVQRDAIIQQINDAATLAAQYEGLASSYNAWLTAEEAGQERDMYENIIEGFENIEDELSRGWLDDGTIKFLELLTGKTGLASKSGKELKEIYDDLDDTIKNTTHSVRDFFTVDEDGNSTNTGVYNFLDAIGQLEEEKFNGKDVVKRDDNGSIIGFDFEIVGGDEAIAEALGISKELVQIMVRAADDAGFVVNIDGAYTQLADLKTEAGTARDALISLKKDGLEQLKDIDVNFDLDAEGDNLIKEQEKAINLLDKFRNKDGTINTKLEGADEALEIAEYLTIKLDDLTEPRYMQIDTSAVEEDLQEPIEKMQEFERLSKEKHLLTLTGDKKGLEEVNAEMDKIAEYLDSIKDEETQVKLGIKGLSKEEIAEKLEKGEIELDAELNVDLQMSDDLKDMRLMMMNQLGLASDNEVKLKIKYDIDDSVVESLTEEEKEVVVKYIADHKEIDNWSPEAKDAFVKYLVDGGDPEKFDPEDKESWVVYKKDSSEPDNYQPDSKTQPVTSKLNSSAVDNYQPEPKTLTINAIFGGIKNAVSNAVSAGKKVLQNRFGIGGANGTANVDGTTGRAFKQGSWGTKNSGNALVGELGVETLVRNGRYYTIGDTGAEFIHYEKGDIIFNHKQTEELFKNGKVTSDGGRGRALVSGTAFSGGTGGGLGVTTTKTTKKETTTTTTTTSTKSGGSSGSGGVGKVSGKSSSSSSSSSSTAKDDFEETFDWIEVAISRVERAIDRLDTKANSVYRSWSERNNALTSEINKVNQEINLQQSAYNRYIREANSVGLSSDWAAKVQNGTVDINTITNEDLAKKIGEYQDWYEKALKCQDAIEELKEKEAKLYAQRVENVATQYEGILSVIEHEKNMLDEYIAQTEANATLVSANYYNALINNERKTVAQLEKEKSDMLSAMQIAMQSGTIAKYSESWYDMVAAVDEVTFAIAESQTALVEYQQTLQQLNWEVFDILQERISNITNEADFLIELISSDKLYDDKGKFTDEGLSTVGLHGQNYNVYMAQADKYADEVAKLNKEIKKDPYDQDLINRRDELLELQRESILAAEDEKEAIRDMVEDGISLELDALQELIDKKNEALESERNLYEYQKKVKKQTEEIASLEKQLSAFAGDDSEEARAKVQELKVSLEEARSDLEETEYDKYISDTQKILDDLYLEYETILNARLDNLDALISDMIMQINANADVIGNTIYESADSVGYTLTESMQTIWGSSASNTINVITTYGERFSAAQTTTNNALNTINTNIQSMITQLNKIASANAASAATSSSANSSAANAKPTTKPTTSASVPTVSTPTSSVGKTIYAGGAKIYDYVGDTSGERQLYRNDPYYIVLEERSGYLKVRHRSLSSGITGWFKKSDVSGYKTGVKDLLNSEVTWTQENGTEYIVRPSDGAILTPLAKGDSVLNANASSNIWDMANSPTEFIKDNLNLGTANIPNNSSVNNNVIQNFENIVFSMPNVHSYNELLSQMAKDKDFEKLILSMSIDRLAGKSSLAKGKVIK